MNFVGLYINVFEITCAPSSHKDVSASHPHKSLANHYLIKEDKNSLMQRIPGDRLFPTFSPPDQLDTEPKTPLVN